MCYTVGVFGAVPNLAKGAVMTWLSDKKYWFDAHLGKMISVFFRKDCERFVRGLVVAVGPKSFCLSLSDGSLVVYSYRSVYDVFACGE